VYMCICCIIITVCAMCYALHIRLRVMADQTKNISLDVKIKSKLFFRDQTLMAVTCS